VVLGQLRATEAASVCPPVREASWRLILLYHQGRPRPGSPDIWPVDDGRYGLDATSRAARGMNARRCIVWQLEAESVPHTFRQELDGAWTLRFGPCGRQHRGRGLPRSFTSQPVGEALAIVGALPPNEPPTT